MTILRAKIIYLIFKSLYRQKHLAYLIYKDFDSLYFPHHKAPLTVHSKINTISKCAANSDIQLKSKQFQRTFESKINKYLIKKDITTACFKGTLHRYSQVCYLNAQKVNFPGKVQYS